jgi:hypothetical protein
MADATYNVIGLALKKAKASEPMEGADYQQQLQTSPRVEKGRGFDKPKSDDHHDDRLSMDSQLDTHLKELR